MGPYGVDRAVHSMEFTDCENGLGKLFLSSATMNEPPWQRFLKANKLKRCFLHLSHCLLSITAYIVHGCRGALPAFTG